MIFVSPPRRQPALAATLVLMKVGINDTQRQTSMCPRTMGLSTMSSNNDKSIRVWTNEI